MHEFLDSYRPHIESKIDECVRSLGQECRLKEACAYALQNGGKRFRPALVLAVAEALGSARDVTDAALAVELFHTASLIADDLPCMDDDKERRGAPATHLAYGESTALLATYALIAEGYERLRLGAPSGEVLDLALACATRTTGFSGATGGQWLDLDPGELDESVVRQTIQKKTGALFELSFVLGWLYGGGEPSQVPLVKKTAHHFGLAFQIADDFQDFAEDVQAERKINYVAVCGRERALSVLEEEMQGLKEGTEALGLLSPFLEEALEIYTVASSSAS